VNSVVHELHLNNAIIERNESIKETNTPSKWANNKSKHFAKE
jgi:hypothetical protein